MSTLIDWWGALPVALKIFLLSLLPFTELRASIPIGILVYKVSALESFFWSVMGSILPVPFIYLFLKWAVVFLMKKSTFFHQLFSWWFSSVRKKFDPSYKKWGIFALALFVAVPLPGTGAWAGTAAAYLFSLDFKKSFWAICAGVIAAGISVLLVTFGVFNFSKLFN